MHWWLVEREKCTISKALSECIKDIQAECFSINKSQSNAYHKHDKPTPLCVR